MSEDGVISTRTMDTTPSPRATALLCIEILESPYATANGQSKEWARQQLLMMIIEDWPEVEQ